MVWVVEGEDGGGGWRVRMDVEDGRGGRRKLGLKTGLEDTLGGLDAWVRGEKLD